MIKRVVELDGIRGIAIAMVIVWHFFTCLESDIAAGSFLACIPKLTTLCYSDVLAQPPFDGIDCAPGAMRIM